MSTCWHALPTNVTQLAHVPDQADKDTLLVQVGASAGAGAELHQ